jgi:carotenoid cleavage dioxygenase
VYDLVVEGRLPDDINGNWYRCTPDPQYPPLLGHDTFLAGDGMVSYFHFENGHVDLKQRYVRTDRFQAERNARRSLFGIYRNPYTDDPSVRRAGMSQSRGTANTTPIYHGGKLLALKEDSRGWQLDPHTLQTIGEWDYDGKLRSPTMTAHPHLDPETGELFFFGYEAGELASRDVAYCVVDKNGRLRHEEWFEAPYCSLMHDFAVTKEHVIFPVFPTTADLNRIKAGGSHWIWEPTKECYVGIMPRAGSVKDLRWFRYPQARSGFHFMNAYTEGAKVHLDFGCGKVNPFPFIREATNVHFDPRTMTGDYVRWTFDLSKPGNSIEETVIGPAGDFPRIADKDFMVDYDVGYYQSFDPTLGPPLIAGPVGGGFNTIQRLEVKTRKITSLAMDAHTTVQEHVHIPSKQAGHEGYLAFVADRHDKWLSEVWLLEAKHPERGAIAKIQIPLRLRVGVHGNWVAAEALRH